MNTNYTHALDTKARWLNWLMNEAYKTAPSQTEVVWPVYEKVLRSPDTHYMNTKFCSLVDHARRTVPDEMKFDLSWTHDRFGFLWLETPFECPHFIVSDELRSIAKQLRPNPDTEIDIKISAVGWVPVGSTFELPDGRRYGASGTGAGTAFLLFHELPEGFGMWSYFTLIQGDTLIERVHNFEATAQKQGGAYKKDRITDELHEIRWIYTAFYLMAQKLAIQIEQQPERAVQRRLRREGHDVGNIKVVSLRRLELDREKAEGEPHPVDWKWQWEVRGHWRNQFYRASNEYHQIFIESYIKGPPDKPLKEPGQKLFVAVR